MVLGVISAVIGAVIFIAALFKEIATVQQQTVQYLGFVCAAIFFVGGFIMITIKKCSDRNSTEYIRSYPETIPTYSESKQTDYLSKPGGVIGSTWLCKKCGSENPAVSNSCKDCGNYR